MKEKKQNPDMEFYADTMEQEQKKQTGGSFNTEEGIMVQKFAQGINQDKGIFDSTALFRTQN